MALAFWQITVGLVVFLCLQVPILEAQVDGFLSIDCGSLENYTDTTGLNWVSDSSYITTGDIANNVTSQRFGSIRRYKTLRYFAQTRNKFCYVLPATANKTYLVRATFLFGNYSGAKTPAFQLHVDTYDVGTIVADSSDSATVFDITMAAVADNIYVCLAPNNPGRDVPFINFIELRDLGLNLTYPKASQGYFLINQYRYNFGGNSLRYPYDRYDRVWDGVGADSPGQNLSTTVNVTYSSYSRDLAPESVLQTAVTWPNTTSYIFPFNVSGGENYVVLLWFAEIVSRAVTQSTRNFSVAIDGDWQPSVDIVKATGAKYLAYEWGYSSVNLTDTSVMAFRADSTSQLGPLLNGLEVYLVSRPVQPRTNEQDASIMEVIKTQLNMTDWTGDPCLNVPYDWSACSTDTPPRVTQLQLGGYNLTGSIPVAIGNLSELTFLGLENNSLQGNITNLSSLTGLQQLHLQNNNLNGTFPTWVADLPALQELYVYGNNLTGYVPSSLINRTGLSFKYSPGNKGLCTGSSATFCTLLSASSPSAAPAAPVSASKSKSNTGLIIGCLAGGIVVAVLLIFLIVCFACCCKRKSDAKIITSVTAPSKIETGSVYAFCGSKPQTKAYSLNEVKEATDNFKNQIGEGGFGPVYRGKLSDGREVAVKRCWPSNKRGATAFFNEVELLSRIHHKNLVSLVGYCQEGQEQIVLYEYMSNGALRTHIHANANDSGLVKAYLPWRIRLEIAVDAAQGLEHLHTGCSPGIIHGDVKPNNILLTSKMAAKVADFGLSMLTSVEDSNLQFSTEVKGSAGYLDPEYTTNGQLTDKSDVYSFGLVLLELVSGEELFDKTHTDRNPSLIEGMRTLLVAGNLKEVVDPALGEKYNLESMWKVAELGMMCVEPRDFNRPGMTDIVRELRDAIVIEDGTTQHDHSMATFSLAFAP